MAITLTSMIAQPFQVATANVTVRLTVNAVTYDVTLTQLWYRTYLASSSGAGTRADVREFLDKTADLFNAAVAGWTVRLRSDGIVEITNSANTWSINWTVAHANGAIWERLLGWTANIGSTAASTYAQAQTQPAFCLFAIGRMGPPPALNQSHAASITEAGIVTGFRSGSGHLTAEYDFQAVPIDANASAALYSSGAYPTPLMAHRGRRWALLSQMTTSFEMPWTWQDTLGTCVGLECGAALGTFQDHIAASTTTYDTAYVMPRTLGSIRSDFHAPTYDKIVRLKGVGLSFAGTATRS